MLRARKERSWRPPTRITDSAPGVLQTAAWMFGSPGSYLRKNHARYGDVVVANPVHLGRVVFFSRPDAIREIFTADPDVLKAGEGNAPLISLFGPHSVLLLDGKPHTRQRRLLMPPFHGKRLQNMYAEMQAITMRASRDWPRDGRAFSLLPRMLDVTLEVILRTVFGVDDRAKLSELTHVLEELLELVSGPSALIVLTPRLQHDLGPWYPWRRFKVLRAKVDKLIFEHIARRRLSPDADGERSDILSMLLAARDEEGNAMTDAELRDELVTLLMAGHETTGTAMSWAFERLLQSSSSRVLARLQNEVDTVLGDQAASGELLKEMPYLDATVREVLRFRPVLPFILRHVAAPIQIGGVDLPVGIRVAASICVTHMRPDVYTAPWSFDPDRFLKNRFDPYSWLPFGGGTRRCIGRTFALNQMKIMLSTMLQTFEFELAQDGPLTPVKRSITSAPSGGTVVRIKAIR